MRIPPRALALLLATWGLLLAWAGGHAPSPCPLGSCPACGACFRRPAVEQTAEGTRVA